MPTRSLDQSDPIYEKKVTSVVPAKVTGESRVHELGHIDVTFTPYYIKGLYVFGDAGDLEPSDFKVPMFEWLVHYVIVCGRIRMQEESGMPFIKLNDAGIRLIEAKARMSVDELLDMEMEERVMLEEKLVPQRSDDGCGGDLSFSPLVLVQITWFKGGGLSLGLNWAHILGDIFSASAFINVLGQFLQARYPTKPLQMPKPKKPNSPISTTRNHTNSPKMNSHSFHINKEQLIAICSGLMCAQNIKHSDAKPFELIVALMWKMIATIRGKSMEPRAVTICKNGMRDWREREKAIPCNAMKIKTVQVDFPVYEADISRLVSMITGEGIEENGISNMNIDQEELGFQVYGERLTFLDVDGADVYGFKIKGQGPSYVNYSINGVGNGGIVSVIPAAPKLRIKGGCDSKLVTVILPEAELEELKILPRTQWMRNNGFINLAQSKGQ